jgi:plasmid maintenance system killer protein
MCPSRSRYCRAHKCPSSAFADSSRVHFKLEPLQSVGLHKLRGGRKAQWAMTISGPWLCFRFADSDAWDVEIIDYH